MRLDMRDAQQAVQSVEVHANSPAFVFGPTFIAQGRKRKSPLPASAVKAGAVRASARRGDRASKVGLLTVTCRRSNIASPLATKRPVARSQIRGRSRAGPRSRTRQIPAEGEPGEAEAHLDPTLVLAGNRALARPGSLPGSRPPPIRSSRTCTPKLRRYLRNNLDVYCGLRGLLPAPCARSCLGSGGNLKAA